MWWGWRVKGLALCVLDQEMLQSPAGRSLTLNPRFNWCLLRSGHSWKSSNQFLGKWCCISSETCGENWWWENKIEKLGKAGNDDELSCLKKTKGAVLKGRRSPGQGRTPLPHPSYIIAGPLQFVCRCVKGNIWVRFESLRDSAYFMRINMCLI